MNQSKGKINQFAEDRAAKQEQLGMKRIRPGVISITRDLQYDADKIVMDNVKRAIFEYMDGKCTEHWSNSTPFRWRCLDCWKALRQKWLGGKG